MVRFLEQLTTTVDSRGMRQSLGVSSSFVMAGSLLSTAVVATIATAYLTRITPSAAGVTAHEGAGRVASARKHGFPEISAVYVVVTEAPELEHKSLKARPLDRKESALVVVPSSTPILVEGREVPLSHIKPGFRLLCRGAWTGEQQTVFRATRVSVGREGGPSESSSVQVASGEL